MNSAVSKIEAADSITTALVLNIKEPYKFYV